MPDLLIWWTNQADCQLISALFHVPDADESEDVGPPTWPRYIAKAYAGRYGRNGRGRLWVETEINGGRRPFGITWPEDSQFAAMLGGHRDPTQTAYSDHTSAAGIVIRATDLHHVALLPGVVTDLQLRPLPPATITFPNVKAI